VIAAGASGSTGAQREPSGSISAHWQAQTASASAALLLTGSKPSASREEMGEMGQSGFNFRVLRGIIQYDGTI
jgi:hypothetical protein